MSINFPATTTSLLVNTWNTSKIVYLPAVSTIGPGKFFYIKDICGNAAKSTIYISTLGLDKIEWSFPPSTLYGYMSTNFGSVLLAPDGGTNWMVLQNYTLNGVKRASKGSLPLTITGLSLWLDATDPLNNGNYPTTNSVVTTWFDKSGLGNNLTGYNNPTFLTTPYRMSNFSGAYFYATSPNSYLMTLFIVYYDNNNDGCAPVYTENPNNDVTGLFANCGGTTYMQTSGGWATQGSTIPKNTQNLLMIQYTSTNGYVWLNGTLNFTISTSPFTRAGISFGKRGGNYLNGFYYEIIHFSSILSLTDRQKIEGYLAWKWGLQTNLPSIHPYKNAAP